VALGLPLFPLYYVREVHAPDTWIGFITTAQTVVMVVGYYVWTRASKERGSRFVLLGTTLGLAVYPALVAATQEVAAIAVLAGLSGIFQAGLDLVFFDELMKTVPPDKTADFVSLAQSLQYLSGVAAPLLGTALADWIGLDGALLVSAGLRLLGWALFTFDRPARAPATERV
jgi:MFS family permease